MFKKLIFIGIWTSAFFFVGYATVMGFGFAAGFILAFRTPPSDEQVQHLIDWIIGYGIFGPIVFALLGLVFGIAGVHPGTRRSHL